ncbi:MAG: C-GCAxxG-C-C family protein [Clostridia bacterium]
MTKQELAAGYFRQGYNCSQAVLLAFADEVDLTKDRAAMLSSSFGGGMGRLREVCGAVSAMFMIAGLLDGYTNPTVGAEKNAHYQRIRDLAQAFRDKEGSIICRELLKNTPKSKDSVPEARTEQYYAIRPCERYVQDAASIVEAYLSERNN